MIALARTICSHEDRFLEILPQLQQQAHFAFRDEPASRCQELVAETIANCCVAFARLATGETTKKAAKRFRVSPGRISQLRRELHAVGKQAGLQEAGRGRPWQESR